MKIHAFTRAAGLALAMALVVPTAAARSSDDAKPDTLCTILGTANRYVGTTVTVRGLAVTEGRATTLKDAHCQGAVALSITGASAIKRDVSSFRRTVSSQGARADATVFGRFKTTGDANRPYAIEVYGVSDVSAVASTEGG